MKGRGCNEGPTQTVKLILARGKEEFLPQLCLTYARAKEERKRKGEVRGGRIEKGDRCCSGPHL